MNPVRTTAFALAVVALAACGRRPEPPPQLPQLQRPVLALAADDTRPGMLVPHTAYVERAGVPGVFVLSEGLARFRMVKAGQAQGEAIEILSGLTGTETLVLGNLQDVHDGSPLQPLK